MSGESKSGGQASSLLDSAPAEARSIGGQALSLPDSAPAEARSIGGQALSLPDSAPPEGNGSGMSQGMTSKHSTLGNVTEPRHTRRQLPHYQEPGSAYFLTFRLAPGLRRLSHPERSQIVALIEKEDGLKYDAHAWVVMDDHVHLLLTPSESQENSVYSLSRILHKLKGISARVINRMRGSRGPLWQSETFDSVIDSDRALQERWQYLLMNPYRKWPRLEWGTYLWVGDKSGWHQPEASLAGKVPAPRL